MDEVLRVVLAALVALSLVALVLYAVAFVVLVVVTTLHRDRPEPAREELDRALEGILGRARCAEMVPPRWSTRRFLTWHR